MNNDEASVARPTEVIATALQEVEATVLELLRNRAILRTIPRTVPPPVAREAIQ